AAGKQIDASGAAELETSPPGKDVCIENIALVCAFRIRSGPKQKDLAEIAGRNVQPAIGRICKPGYLGRAHAQQVAEVVFPGNREYMTTVPSASDQRAMSVEGQRINKIFAGRPDTRGRAVRSDAIDLRSSGRIQTRCGKRAQHRCVRTGRTGRSASRLRTRLTLGC